MKWHEEVLDVSGHRAVARIQQAVGKEFYLAGGTALALRLGHRISLDLDLFSAENLLGRSERSILLQKLKSSGELQIREEKDGTCHLRLGKTAASLFHYAYPLLTPTSDWNGLRVASLEDISAMKLSAVLGRGARKDFIDLHQLCLRIGFKAVMSAGSSKFAEHTDFDLQAARALVYFEDAEKEPLPRLLLPASWAQIKSFFAAEVSRYVRLRLAD
jgi:predicted nucleotidyltransferase component of viral defense system